MPLLSLLIPTLDCRRSLLARSMGCLTPQLTSDIEVLTELDNGEATIGEKRNRLLDRASGDYLAFVDDDDLVVDHYVCSLVMALETRPDCVGFKVARMDQLHRNKPPQRAGTYWHTLANKVCGDYGRDNQWRHDRWPGHLQPVRADLAKDVRFQPWCFGEDRDYQMRLRPRLKSEVFIDDDLYFYLLRSADVREHETVHPRRWHDDRQIRISLPTSAPANA